MTQDEYDNLKAGDVLYWDWSMRRFNLSNDDRPLKIMVSEIRFDGIVSRYPADYSNKSTEFLSKDLIIDHGSINIMEAYVRIMRNQ
jgi:hypothetical protein